MEIFGEEWLAAWRAEINDDPVYADKGARWVGPVILKAWPNADRTRTRAVVLDLAEGRCLEARSATGEDPAAASLVIGGSLGTWATVLEGRLDPVAGLMSGKLKLEKGNLLKILPFADGARAMLNAAVRVGGELPDLAAEAMAQGPDGSASDSAPGALAPELPVAGAPEPPPGTSHASEPGSISDAEPRARDFKTTGRSLDHDSFPMRLWHKAKRLGAWNPQDIDFAADAEDWRRLDDRERDLLLRLTTLFQAGEEAVAIDLLPLIDTVAEEGRLEEEMYLTSFLYEEAKHVEVFRRFLDEVASAEGDLTGFLGPAYAIIFEHELPAAMGALRTDRSRRAQARAAVTYNMIVEGVLAETGYQGYLTILDRAGILPGTREAVTLVKRDESRHIAYGLHLLSRLGTEGGESVWETIEARMEALLDPALQVVRETFAAYEAMPFGLDVSDFLDFGLDQFRRRHARLELARRDGGLVAEEPG